MISFVTLTPRDCNSGNVKRRRTEGAGDRVGVSAADGVEGAVVDLDRQVRTFPVRTCRVPVVSMLNVCIVRHWRKVSNKLECSSLRPSLLLVSKAEAYPKGASFRQGQTL